MIYQIWGIFILSELYGIYFAKMAAQRKRGIRTDQIGEGKTGFVKAIEVAMKIATYLVVAVELVSLALGTTAFPDGIRLAGAIVASVGVAVFIAAAVTMRDSWRAGVSPTDETALITVGIYRYSRNPAFLGFDMVYIGFVLMFFNGALLAASAFAALMLHLQIVNVEEDFLICAFGEEYLAYRKKVCRYIGRR